MRRLVSLLTVLLFSVPVGISVSGCSKVTPVTYCNGDNSAGLVLGQTVSLDLEPRQTGISLNQGQIGQLNAPSGQDCRATATTISGTRYGSTNMNLVDIVPLTGRLCAGTWNRNTGGNIPDYTTCTPNGGQGTAFVTASAEGVTSNPLPVFVHPVATNIVLGAPSTNCPVNPQSPQAGEDAASNCYVTSTLGACVTGAPPTFGTPFNGNACVSQGGSAQLAARVFAGTQNISCSVGPLRFSAQTGAIVGIDQNGLATAAQPGSTVINAATSQASSTAGFFNTCPPQTITLTIPGQTTAPTTAITVNQNVAQNLVATVTDTNQQPITNISLTYVSTSPTVIPVAGGAVTPAFPGAAAITALCEPPSCNPSPLNLQGLYGNGLPVFSNPVQITAPGTTSSTILYIASTQSQYIQPIDFTVNTQSPPLRLPFEPNSLQLSQDLSSIYLGTDHGEIMVLSASTAGLTLTRQDTSISGRVLAVSPDNTTVVVTDPTRNLIYLYLSGGGVSSEYGGTAVSAQWSPDSQFVYITTTDGRLLVHSTFNGWTAVPLSNNAPSVAVTVPSAGVYLGNNPGAGSVTARTDCPVTTVAGTGLQQTTSNTFYPQADVSSASASQLAATNDGVHILGASTLNFTDLTTNKKSGACPIPFTSAVAATRPFITAVPTSITGVVPTSDSVFALVTYTGTGGVVPQYAPATTTLSNIALQATTAGAPTAPVAGVITTDNNTAFVGTTGDNLVHRLTRGTTGFADTLTPITPALPNINGTATPATPNLLAQRPRRATS